MAQSETLHASCVSYQDKGVLILGPSGSGKSSLALRLIAMGAQLVADDQTILTPDLQGRLIATCPKPLSGMIEARGLGLLSAPCVPSAPVSLVIDMGTPETDRLPPHRKITLSGISLDLVLQSQNDHFPAAVLVYLAFGRVL